MSRGDHEIVVLPSGWWDRLTDLIIPRWPSLDNFYEDVPTVSARTLMRARLRGRITVRTFHTLAQKLKTAPGQLLAELKKNKHAGISDVLRIASIEDVLDWKWDGHQLLDELIRLDY